MDFSDSLVYFFALLCFNNKVRKYVQVSVIPHYGMNETLKQKTVLQYLLRTQAVSLTGIPVIRRIVFV